jgi:cell division protein FtsN
MKLQGSGFLPGLVVGLLVGLSLALGVAIYVNKVPIPFLNKVPQRTAEQDAAEAEKNKNWDPNSALRSKALAPGQEASAPAQAAAGRPAPIASGIGTTPAAPSAPVPPATAAATPRLPSDAPAVRGGPPPSARAAPAIVGDAAAPAPGVAKPAATASPQPGPDPFIYFVQAGAFGQSEDAEQQRAKLAVLGFEARLSERDQSGRTMFRVRIGPYEKKDEAEAAKERLSGAGVEASLVRVQK